MQIRFPRCNTFPPDVFASPNTQIPQTKPPRNRAAGQMSLCPRHSCLCHPPAPNLQSPGPFPADNPARMIHFQGLYLVGHLVHTDFCGRARRAKTFTEGHSRLPDDKADQVPETLPLRHISSQLPPSPPQKAYCSVTPRSVGGPVRGAAGGK